MYRRNGIRRFGILLFCATVGLGGCHSLHRKKQVDLPIQSIDIGGNVQNPSTIAIPAQGLTLKRALTLAGSRDQKSVGLSVQNQSENPINNDLVAFVDSVRTIERLNVQIGLIEFSYAENVDGKTSDLLKQELNYALERKRESKRLLEKLFNVDNSITATLETNVSIIAKNIERMKRMELVEKFENAMLQNNANIVEEMNKQIENAKKEIEPFMNSVKSSGSISTQFLERPVSLVSLERQEDGKSTTHYFDYQSAVTGLPSGIRLKPNDLIQVVDIQDTTLNPNISPALGKVRVAVLGFQRPASNSRNRYLGEVVVGQLDQNSTIKNDNRRSITIFRRAADGIGQDVFVIPANWFNNNQNLINQTRLFDGDIVGETLLPRIPIILDSLVEKVVAAREAQKANTTIESSTKLRQDVRGFKRTIVNRTGGLSSKILQNGQKKLNNGLLQRVEAK